MIAKANYSLWVLCLIVIFQSAWLLVRINTDAKRRMAFEQEQAEAEAKKAQTLATVPEPSVGIALIKGGQLQLEPNSGTFLEDFNLEIWAETDRPITKIDLRIFYPAQLLELVSDDWTVDKKGVAFFSSTFESPKEGKFLLTEIVFKPLAKGEAKVEFDFTKESLLDSNLITSENSDILEDVGVGEYFIEVD